LKHEARPEKNPLTLLVIVKSTMARAKNEMNKNAHTQVVWSSPVTKSMYGPKHATMREEEQKTCVVFGVVEQLIVLKR